MTSTPTLCQVCGREQFIDNPRQPDMSAEPRVVTELQQLIDTPTVERTNAQIESVCKKAQLAIAMLMQGHARALKEMGARIEELHRRIDRYIKENCATQEQLAAALAKLKEFDEYYTFQNLERVERQLAAAQGELGDLKASMRSWEVAKEIEILANSDKQWNELIAQRDAYEALIEHAIELGHLGEGSTQNWARQVLATHRRGGEGV